MKKPETVETVRGVVVVDNSTGELVERTRFTVLEPDGRVRELHLRVGRGTLLDPKAQGGKPEGGRPGT